MIRSLWALARPGGMPLVLALPAAGYGYAHWEWALPLQHPVAFGWVLAAWWFLSAGTLWLNAALDRDDNEVLMGPRGRVELPEHLVGWGLAALAGAVGLGFAAGVVPGLFALVCAALAVAYSDPRTAWKGHPVLGPAVNVLGYGLLSPAAGFAVVGAPPTARTAVAAALLGCWIAATYFAAQAHQELDDRSRGYRTLVATHGTATVVAVGRALYGVAISGLIAGSLAGLFPLAVVVAAGPWWALDRSLVAWGGRGAAGGRRMLRRATGLAVVVLAAAVAQHEWQVIHGEPPAGLGTPWRPL